MSRDDSKRLRKFREPMTRWALLCAYSGVGLLFGVPLSKLYRTALAAVTEPFGAEWEWMKEPFSIAVTVLLLSYVVKQSGTKLRHFRHMLRYPPTIVAVLIAWCVVLGALHLRDAVLPPRGQRLAWMTPWLAGTGILIVGMVVVAAAQGRRKGRRRAARKLPSPADEIDAAALAEMPMAKLQRWLANESPIIGKEHDYLRSAWRARRVWTALQTTRPNADGREWKQTVVVQGPFGSGKSSLVQLVEQEAEASRGERYIFAHVNCWGFSSVAAQEHILEEAIDALSEHVDCLGLRRVPAAYADAITETSSWLRALADSFGPPSSPLEHLKRFTPVLRAIRAQLVIVIEDTDRNGPEFDQRHIEAMLYNFRQVERISFVLTAGRSSQIEFPKVAEQIVFLPPISRKVVLALLDRVRQHCRTHWPVIDPTKTEGARQNRPETLQGEAASREQASHHFGQRVPSWAQAVAELMQTPRRLKEILSAILTRWEALHGEVDLDELIMITALRHAAPGVFTFLGVNVTDLRLLRPWNETNEQKEVEKQRHAAALRKRYEQAIASSEHHPEHLATILSDLQPKCCLIGDTHSFAQANRAQSISSRRGDIYWERLTSESLDARGLRDQAVLTAVQKAHEPGGAEALGAQLADSAEFLELFIFFEEHGSSLSFDAAKQTASAAVRRFRDRLRGELLDLENYPEFRIWLTRRVRGFEKWTEWLESELLECVPSRLQLANELYFGFVRGNVPEEVEVPIRGRMVGAVRQSSAALSADEFARCFNRDFPYVLNHLMWLDRQPYPPQLLTEPQQWRWLATPLLNGMERVPEVLNPQVMCAFGEWGPRGDAPTYYRFEEEKLRGVFAEETQRVYSLLAREFDVSYGHHEGFRAVIPFARTEAARLSESGRHLVS